MAKRNKRSRQKARTPTIQNSGYSNGGASHESNILKAYNPRKYSAKSDVFFSCAEYLSEIDLIFYIYGYNIFNIEIQA